MRGKDFYYFFVPNRIRITPAYAGKRLVLDLFAGLSQDHPRVCGEKPLTAVESDGRLGSPPRMRGKDLHHLRRLRRPRITPAYAGKR